MTRRWLVSLILHTLAVLAVVATLSFFVLQVIPGDPAAVVAGIGADEETLQAVRSRMGLDRPLAVRYFAWVGGILRGDLGQSLTQQTPVSRLIAQRLPLTASLALLALGFSSVLAVGLALLSRLGRPASAVVRVVEYMAFAMPQFWVGLLLLALFGFRLGWFPVIGGEGVRRLILPALALALGNAAILSRTLRASLDEQVHSEHIAAARVLGIPRRRVVCVHLLPLAVIPAVSVLAIQAGYLLAGAIVVEQVFGLPGLGRLAIAAIAQRDLPLVQGVVLVFAVAFPVFSALADLVVLRLWPRLGAPES